MKLIKAYIRTNMIDKVVQALESLGFTDMTVIDVKAVRRGIDPKTLDYSVELAERYMNVAKLEIVLQDDHADLAKEMILKTARTGKKGDGLVYVSSVDEAIIFVPVRHRRKNRDGNYFRHSTESASASDYFCAHVHLLHRRSHRWNPDE